MSAADQEAAAKAAADDKPVVAGPIQFLPTPDKVDLLKQVTDPQLDGTIRRLYFQHLVANTPPTKLRDALESLATPEARKRIQLDINYLLEHPDEIVPYFTSKDADEVLLLVGNVLKGQKVDPYNLTPAQQTAVKTALETKQVDNWLARKYRKTQADKEELMKQTPPTEAPPMAPLTSEQMKDYMEPFPKLAHGNGTIRVASPPQTLTQMLASIQHFNPKSGVKSAPAWGRLQGFRPMRIPVVFHLLGFTDKDNKYLPPYYWFADKAAAHLIEVVNKYYAGTGFSFYIPKGGVRWDPRKYPYLNRGGQFAWQDCGEQCWNGLSSRYNVQGGPINVWVAGSFEGAFKCTPLAVLCQLSANGLTTSNPGANDQFRPGGQDSMTQLIYINYDRFSPDGLNRASAWEGGGVVLAHEIGHYFGLLHTFEGGCSPPDDGVSDTPANLDPDSGWQRSWLSELTNWCKAFRQGQGPDPKALLKFKSCPNRGGKDVVDNVFNMMSYLDDVCRMAWTENQVARLQWAAMTYRPKMMAKYAVKA